MTDTEKIVQALDEIRVSQEKMLEDLKRLADTLDDYTYQPEDEPDEEEIDISGRVELWRVH